MRYSNLIKRITAAVAALSLSIPAMTALPCSSAAASGNNILILGDSISAGYGLKDGESGFYDYMAACTGMQVTNLAETGAATADLIELIDTQENAGVISSADIICISIGGNDLLAPAQEVLRNYQKEDEGIFDTIRRVAAEGDPVQLMSELTGALIQPRNTAKGNYAVIVEKLRNLNPDATIILQTIYNPMEVSPEFLEQHNLSGENLEKYDMLLSYVGNNEKILNKAMAALASDTVKIADVSAAFEGSGWLYDRVLEKDVHPNALGHALIAAVVMDAAGITQGTDSEFSMTLEKQLLETYYAIPEDDLALLNRYAAPSNRPFGDQSGNGQFGIEDAIGTLRIYSEIIVAIPMEQCATYGDLLYADVTGDGKFSIEDAMFSLSYYVEFYVIGNPVTWYEITHNPNAPGAP